MAIYAIDFDNTLAITRFPEIIAPNKKMVAFAKTVKAQGHKIILWTSRAGADLENAVEWCRLQGIVFDAVNEPLPEQIKRWGKQYLGQYYYAKMKKKQLEARLRTFRENMLGTKGMQYSPVPRSQTNSVGDGPATQVIRAMEIEDRIESQKAEMAKTMLNVMKIMDFLPTDSTERSILEYRHIDCLSWKQVCKEANMTRTPCNKYYNAGIDKLLTYKKVQSILQEFASLQEPSKP